MTKLHIGLAATIVATFGIGLAAVEPAAAEVNQCWSDCVVMATGPDGDQICYSYIEHCMSVGDYIQAVAQETCGKTCERRVKHQYDTHNGRITITKQGRAVGLTVSNVNAGILPAGAHLGTIRTSPPNFTPINAGNHIPAAPLTAATNSAATRGGPTANKLHREP